MLRPGGRSRSRACSWHGAPFLENQAGAGTVWIALKALGVVGLMALLAIFRGERGPAEFPIVGRVEDWAWLRSGWWGILGLIGWAYLTAALLTLGFGRRREWLMGAMALLMALHLAMNHDGLFSRVEKKAWLGLRLGRPPRHSRSGSTGSIATSAWATRRARWRRS